MQTKKSEILLSIFLVVVVILDIYFFLAKESGGNKVPTQTSSSTVNAATSSFASTTTASKPTSTVDTSPSASSTNALLQNMTMTFDDEFNSFSRYVDASGNITCNPGGTGTWQTVYAFCSRTNASNEEAEVYIDPGFLAYLKKESNSTAEADPENPFSVSDGVLAIKAAPSDQQILAAVGSWAQYTSGMITTQFSFSQEYGYFEMRAELPAGRGLWPAFWLLPTNKSWPPEIDALEAFGATSSQKQGGSNLIHYASHALVNNQNCGAWYNTGTNITAGFHTYGVDVEPTGITYYFDGKAYATCPANSAVDLPMYMLINLAVGGTDSWPGTPDASNTWPAYLDVDYVRAYQQNSRLASTAHS